jgi:hypothetical protein
MTSDDKHEKNSYGIIKATEYNGIAKYSQMCHYKDTSTATMLINNTIYSMHIKITIEVGRRNISIKTKPSTFCTISVSIRLYIKNKYFLKMKFKFDCMSRKEQIQSC